VSVGTRRRSKLTDETFIESDTGPLEISHQTIPIGELCANPDNPRYYYDDPETLELADSMQHVGQLQDIVVTPRKVFVDHYPELSKQLPRRARWVVILGNRRLAAARIAKLSTLNVRVARNWSDIDAIEQAIMHENVHRRGLPPLLEADRIQRLMTRTGKSARQIAGELKKSHSWVNRRLALLGLIPEFKELLRSDTLGIKEAERLSKLGAEEQRAALAAGPPYAPSDSALGRAERSPQEANTDKTADTPSDSPSSTELPSSDLPSAAEVHAPVAGPQGSSPVKPLEPAEPPEGTKLPPQAHQPHETQRKTVYIGDSTPADIAAALRSQLTLDEIQELIRLLIADTN